MPLLYIYIVEVLGLFVFQLVALLFFQKYYNVTNVKKEWMICEQ